ncbi:hypothetical protein ACWXWU_10580 [Shewanella sp. A14]
MLSQQKSDDDLLTIYGRVIAMLVLLGLLAVFGMRYLNNTSNLGGRGLQFEHNRFLNVLAMVRSQWLASGRPHKMLLSWHNVASNVPYDIDNNDNKESIQKNNRIQTDATNEEVESKTTDNWISMSDQGWPIIDTNDAQGCERLWGQLLATNVHELHLTVDYQPNDNICRYDSTSKASLRYQLQTGRVIFFDE